jgi:hypothetical protein
MNDDDLFRLLNEYLEPPGDPNPSTAGIRVVWERSHPGFGARHMWEEHKVSEREVEEVLFEIPPHVGTSPSTFSPQDLVLGRDSP